MKYKNFFYLVYHYNNKKFILILLLACFQALFGAAASLSVSPLMKVVFEPTPENCIYGLNVYQIIIGFILIQVVWFIVNLCSELIRFKFTQVFSSWLMRETLSKVLRKDYRYYTENDSAVIQQGVYTYASQMPLLSMWYLDFIAKMCMLSAFCVVAIILSPLLSIMVLAVGFLYYGLVLLLLKKKRVEACEKLNDSDSKLQSLSLQFIQSIKMLRISGKIRAFESMYAGYVKSYSTFFVRAKAMANLPRMFIELLMMVLLVAYVLILYKQGTLKEELPTIGVLIFIIFKAFPMLQTVYHQFIELASRNYILTRVHGIYTDTAYKTYEEVDDANLIFLKKSISLKGISHQYNKEKAIISFPDIEIKKGEKIGIVGSSGSGKSTLLDILLGFNTPLKGSVQIDEVTYEAEDLLRMHRNVGYVGQQVQLLNGTIAENIALDNKELIDEERLKCVAQIASIGEFIESLPLGFDTQVGDRGLQLSGGQCQRITIARALYKDPQILIFDEATSALDSETERRIIETIHSLPAELTIIMVTHRLSTLDHVDRIIDLKSVGDDSNKKEDR